MAKSWGLLLTLILLLAAGAMALESSEDATRETRVIIQEQGAIGIPDLGRTDRNFPDGRDDPDLCEGWPVDLGAPGGGYPYTPTLFDIDSDGADEIFLTGGNTFGLRGDGSFLSGWPTTEQYYMGYGTNGNMPGPSVADVNLFGNAEVMWTLRDWYAGSSHIWTFNGKTFNGGNMPGFPQDAPDEGSNALGTPCVLADTSGDAGLEAWGAHSLGNSGINYRVSALDNLGNRLFTRDLNSSEDVQALYHGDLEGDGTKEVFAVSWLSPSYILYAFNGDGSDAPGYPVTLQTLSSGYLTLNPPIPADLDGDGDLEFIMGNWGGTSSLAYASHHDGSPVAGFPISIATGSQLFYLGLGDLNGDGRPELLATDNELSAAYRVHALDMSDGLPLPGWPVSLPSWPKGFPCVVDVTNNGLKDVCIATDGGKLYAINGAGEIIDGYPKTMIEPSISGVAAGDIDGDGLFELVAATWAGWVYAWNTPTSALPWRTDWPMRGIDARYSGVYGNPGDGTAVGEESWSRRSLLRVARNPAGSEVDFIIDAPAFVEYLEIFDTRGRLVETLRTWGQDRRNWVPEADLPSGVYFARVRGASSAPVKFVLIR